MRNSCRLLLCLTVSCSFLSPLCAETKRVAVTIDATKTRDDINPFIYGQFIEHLGRCVYGGIWAEMLEDRKFYFPITNDYHPYKSLEETPFPVVGASPWQIITRSDDEIGLVVMDRSAPFVGKHTPVFSSGTAIQHRDLAVVKGQEYVGYVWAKGTAKLDVSLIADDTKNELGVDTSTQLGNEYHKYAYRFVASSTTDHAVLRLAAMGEGMAYIGAVSLMPADNVRGMRKDTLALVKQLNAPMYRWPGGNFVSGYEWRDGIGQRDRRPPRKNPAWTGVEHNDVGIVEFLDFCREVNAEPLIAANTGFGDAHSAAAEVDFCNGAADTYGGGLRAAAGHAEPFNVKYWCVGNEMFGAWQLGYMQVGQYAIKHNQCAEAMLLADPTIELIGVGELNGRDAAHDPDRKYGWSETMLRSCAEHMDYLSEHFYTGQTPWTQKGPSESVIEHVDEMRKAIRDKAAGHRKLQDRLGLTGDKRVPIAMDEWNYWHRDYVYGELGCRYDLADALGVAVGLHEYYRNTDIIHMAHYAQTVNVIGCIKTTKTDAFLATTALPLMLYRNHFGKTPVAVTFQGKDYDVDISAAWDDDGKALTLGVVNPNADAVTLNLSFAGKSLAATAEQWLVAGDNPKAFNAVGESPVKVVHSKAPLRSEWTAPGYSFAVIRIPAQ